MTEEMSQSLKILGIIPRLQLRNAISIKPKDDRFEQSRHRFEMVLKQGKADFLRGIFDEINRGRPQPPLRLDLKLGLSSDEERAKVSDKLWIEEAKDHLNGKLNRYFLVGHSDHIKDTHPLLLLEQMKIYALVSLARYAANEADDGQPNRLLTVRDKVIEDLICSEVLVCFESAVKARKDRAGQPSNIWPSIRQWRQTMGQDLGKLAQEDVSPEALYEARLIGRAMAGEASDEEGPVFDELIRLWRPVGFNPGTQQGKSSIAYHLTARIVPRFTERAVPFGAEGTVAFLRRVYEKYPPLHLDFSAALEWIAYERKKDLSPNDSIEKRDARHQIFLQYIFVKTQEGFTKGFKPPLKDELIHLALSSLDVTTLLTSEPATDERVVEVLRATRKTVIVPRSGRTVTRTISPHDLEQAFKKLSMAREKQSALVRSHEMIGKLAGPIGKISLSLASFATNCLVLDSNSRWIFLQESVEDLKAFEKFSCSMEDLRSMANFIAFVLNRANQRRSGGSPVEDTQALSTGNQATSLSEQDIIYLVDLASHDSIKSRQVPLLRVCYVLDKVLQNIIGVPTLNGKNKKPSYTPSSEEEAFILAQLQTAETPVLKTIFQAWKRPSSKHEVVVPK